MATIVFDFDNTLFESQSHKAAMFDFFAGCAIPREKVIETFEELIVPRGRMYDMAEHGALLSAKGFPISERAIEEFLARPLEAHLMPGAKEMLAELRRRGHRLILVTKGIDSFQRLKVRQSGIGHFFAEIHTCAGKKEDVIAQLGILLGSYFINDSAKETKAVAERFPDLRCILFASEYGKSGYRGEEKGLRQAHSCVEIPDMIVSDAGPQSPYL